MWFILKKSWGFREAAMYWLVEPVSGYSRMVTLIKLLLVVLAVGIMGVMGVLLVLGQTKDQYKITFSYIEKGSQGQKPKMINPLFQGVDSNDQPYNIGAKEAIQESEELLFLNSINADIKLSDGNWMTLSAADGTFFATDRILDVLGDVNVISSDGHKLVTNAAQIDFKHSSAFGSDPVEGEGPLGTLGAQGFMVEEKGQHIIFTGGVKVVFYPEKKENKEDQ